MYFLPSLSASLPAIGIAAAYAKVNILIIHMPVLSSTPKLPCIIVLAGVTIPVSIAPMNIPSIYKTAINTKPFDFLEPVCCISCLLLVIFWFRV